MAGKQVRRDSLLFSSLWCYRSKLLSSLIRAVVNRKRCKRHLLMLWEREAYKTIVKFPDCVQISTRGRRQSRFVGKEWEFSF